MAEQTAASAKAAQKKVPAQKSAPRKTANAAKFVEPTVPEEKPADVEAPPASRAPERPRAGSWIAVKALVLGGRGRSHVGQVLVEIEGRGDVQEVLVKLDRIIGPAEPPVPDEPRVKGRIALVGGVAFQLVDTTHARGWQGVGEEKLRTWEELHALGNVVVL